MTFLRTGFKFGSLWSSSIAKEYCNAQNNCDANSLYAMFTFGVEFGKNYIEALMDAEAPAEDAEAKTDATEDEK